MNKESKKTPTKAKGNELPPQEVVDDFQDRIDLLLKELYDDDEKADDYKEAK